MRPELDFAFLGPHNSFVARVTWGPLQPDRRDEFSKPRHYGIPEHWVAANIESTNSRYTANICGNDCFAFVGHHAKGATMAYTEKSGNLIKEIEALQSFALKVEEKSNEPLFIRLGPRPGSFFAISPSLKRYRWAHLPADLEDAIQAEICRNGYGNIQDVSINAAEGWVIQFREDGNYAWGGILPQQLENALSIGRGKKKVKNLYLNHQNKDEYVLIFEDGNAHVSLHEECRKDMKELVEASFASNLPSFFSKLKRVTANLDFVASCVCPRVAQMQKRAAYYNQRGRFHLTRHSPEQALSYMREAYRLDITNSVCREDYFMARVEAKKFEPGAEDSLQEDGAFQIESEFQYNRARRTNELKARLKQMRSEVQQQNRPFEWKYIEAPPQPINIDGPIELQVGSGPFELDSPTHSEVSIARESTSGYRSSITSEHIVPKGIRYYYG